MLIQPGYEYQAKIPKYNFDISKKCEYLVKENTFILKASVG